jgi:hypothetical protein
MIFELLLFYQIVKLLREGITHKMPLNIINIYILLFLDYQIFIYIKLYTIALYFNEYFYMINIYVNLERYGFTIKHWIYEDCRTIINYFVETIYDIYWRNIDELLNILEKPNYMTNNVNTNTKVFDMAEDILSKDFINENNSLEDIVNKLQEELNCNNKYLDMINEIRHSLGKDNISSEKFNSAFDLVKDNYLNYYE